LVAVVLDVLFWIIIWSLLTFNVHIL